jgi:hypothetical protein
MSIPQTILVPQGAEYRAVCQGLSRIKAPKPLVVPIPVSPKPLTRYLERWQQTEEYLNASQSSVLVMGLCGSLSPHHVIGDIVLYQACVYQPNESASLLRACDRHLTTVLHRKLEARVSSVRALTSDRVIFSAQEKRHLAQIYDTQVVDMEGFAALDVLTQAGVAVAMVRVISDDSDHNLPNLTSALSPEGSLQPLPLAIAMLRQPIAATRLVGGALHGLRVLQNVTKQLFSQ